MLQYDFGGIEELAPTIGSLAYGIHAGPNISSICKNLKTGNLMRIRIQGMKGLSVPAKKRNCIRVEEQLNEKLTGFRVTERLFQYQGLEQLNCMLEKVVVNQ